MSQIEHHIECTPVTDASMPVSKTSTHYAFTRFFFFTFHMQLGQIFEFSYLISDLIIEFPTFKLYNVIC